jgi:mono/diheme cytochrome c family protein
VIKQGANLTNSVDITEQDRAADSPSVVEKPIWQNAKAIAAIIVAVVMGAILWLLQPPLDAYTQSVLSLTGNVTQGRSIFVMNCVACHGEWAAGKVGPNLHGVSDRKSDVRLIHQVVSGETPPMPQFQPSPQDMADLLSYLKSL